jgi:hypothetical protein
MPTARAQKTPTIDDEIAALLPPLSPETERELEDSLLRDGCREALVVWKEGNVLLDGHNRLAICQRYDISYAVKKISLPDKAAALSWVVGNQLGRRNLTQGQLAYYRGKRYALEHHQGKRRDLRTSANSWQKFGETMADRLGAEFGVSAGTVRNDADFANAVDTLATNVGGQTRDLLLTDELKVPHKHLRVVATLSPAEQRKIFSGPPDTVQRRVESAVQRVNTERLGRLMGVDPLPTRPRVRISKSGRVVVVPRPAPTHVAAHDVETLREGLVELASLGTALTRVTASLSIVEVRSFGDQIVALVNRCLEFSE